MDDAYMARKGKQDTAAADAAREELKAVLSQIADAPGGREALLEMAIGVILPIEEKVRRENPKHPTLALIDERRKAGRLGDRE